jgi:hypothetical protein
MESVSVIDDDFERVRHFWERKKEKREQTREKAFQEANTAT